MLAKKLAGVSTTAIAQEEGLSRRWTGQELASAECRQIVLGLVDVHRERIGKLFVLTLDSIEEAFKANKVVVSDFDPLDLGPDHFARLTAARRYLDVISLGRPTAAAAGEKATGPTLTLEQLEAIVAANRKQAVN